MKKFLITLALVLLLLIGLLLLPPVRARLVAMTLPDFPD